MTPRGKAVGQAGEIINSGGLFSDLQTYTVVYIRTYIHVHTERERKRQRLIQRKHKTIKAAKVISLSFQISNLEF